MLILSLVSETEELDTAADCLFSKQHSSNLSSSITDQPSSKINNLPQSNTTKTNIKLHNTHNSNKTDIKSFRFSYNNPQSP